VNVVLFELKKRLYEMKRIETKVYKN